MPFEMYLDYTDEDLLWLTRLYRRTRKKLVLALRILARVILVLSGLYCLKSYFFWLRLEYNAVLLLVYAVAVFGFLVYSFFQDRLRAREANKQRKANGGVTTIFFSEEQFECTARNVKAQYNYGAIRELWYSKSHSTFYLFMDKKSAIIVPERCFTQGDPAAFSAFLSGKTGLEVKEMK